MDTEEKLQRALQLIRYALDGLIFARDTMPYLDKESIQEIQDTLDKKISCIKQEMKFFHLKEDE